MPKLLTIVMCIHFLADNYWCITQS